MKLDNYQYKIIKHLSEKYEISEEEIIEIVYSPFIFIRSIIKNIILTGKETQEEFLKKTKNFNIPSIGKLYANYFNFKRLNNGRKSNSEKGKS